MKLLRCIVIIILSTGISRAAWNVADAGATGDGRTDCTAIFQKLLDDAGKAGGGIVEVPAGRYKIASNLTIPALVTLQGVFRVPPTPAPISKDVPGGSVLLAFAGRGDTNAPPFIRLAGNNASIAGLVISYPEWTQAQVPPVPYPPCIFSQDTDNVGVRDCCLLNPYEGIKFVRAHRHLIRNVTGYPIKRGIFVDECYDIGHIENVHLWPFGVTYRPEEPYCKWINTHGVAFEIARADWHYVHNTFCFGYGIGYLFSQSKHGSCNGNFLGLGADSCQRAVVVEQAQAPGLLISNGEFVGRWTSTNSVCFEVAPGAQGKVSLVNCSFWGPIDRCVWMRSPTAQFTASACNFVDWDNANIGSPAIDLEAGRAIVQACTFSRENLHVKVGSNVTSAIITANQAPGGIRIHNNAGKRTLSSLNESDAIEWTPSTLAHYQVLVGERSDSRFLSGWHNAETHAGHWRWSKDRSQLLLPIVRERSYVLQMEVEVPAAAKNPEAGIYLEGRKLAELPNSGAWTVEIPAQNSDLLKLDLRVAGWIPARTVPNSTDGRMLGIQLHRITMQAKNGPAPSRPFNANTGQ